jgi:hypothetical protein
MLRLNQRQREMASDKLADLANLAAGALVFGQGLAGPFTGTAAIAVAAVGVALWALLTWAALRLARENRR